MRGVWMLALGMTLGVFGSVLAQQVPVAGDALALAREELFASEQRVVALTDQLGVCEINMGNAHRSLAQAKAQLLAIQRERLDAEQEIAQPGDDK